MYFLTTSSFLSSCAFFATTLKIDSAQGKGLMLHSSSLTQNGFVNTSVPINTFFRKIPRNHSDRHHMNSLLYALLMNLTLVNLKVLINELQTMSRFIVLVFV